MMPFEIHDPDSAASQQTHRPFLQLFAVALVCLIFVVLFLIMGGMHLKALDQSLTALMMNRGNMIIRNIQGSVEAYVQQLVQQQPAVFHPTTGMPLDDNVFELKESFLLELLDLARRIDMKAESRTFDTQQLESLSVDENVKFIALLDENGRILLSNRSIPPELYHFSKPVLQGRQNFRMNIFNRNGHHDEPAMIALRRQSRKGCVILGLGSDGTQYRQIRFAVQKTIDDMNPDPDFVYLAVTDRHGTVIVQTGTASADAMKSRDFNGNVTDSTRTRRITAGNRNILEIGVPFYLEGQVSVFFHLGLALDVPDRILAGNRRSIFISMAFMVLLALISMGFLYLNQNRYLKKMKEMERRIHQAERLSALGRLAAGVAHEIRNPLNAISMAIQRIQKDSPHRLIDVVRDEIRRLNQIIEEFISISKSRKMNLKPCDLKMLLEPIILLLSSEAQAKNIRILTVWPEPAFPMIADPDKIKQAFINIINNAIESIAEEGRITLTMKTEGRHWINASIADTGCGLPPEEMEHIFDMDYTTKDKGLGLGLPLAHEIIRAHGGDIHVSSTPDKGTQFDIVLPLAELEQGKVECRN